MGSPADGLFNAQLWQSIAPPDRTPGHNLRAQVTVRGILSTADGYRVGRAGPNMRVMPVPNRSSGDGGTESTTAPTDVQTRSRHSRRHDLRTASPDADPAVADRCSFLGSPKRGSDDPWRVVRQCPEGS